MGVIGTNPSHPLVVHGQPDESFLLGKLVQINGDIKNGTNDVFISLHHLPLEVIQLVVDKGRHLRKNVEEKVRFFYCGRQHGIQTAHDMTITTFLPALTRDSKVEISG